MNTSAFLVEQRRYFKNSYREFEAFGGPCVYFHLECLRAGREQFLSERHLEMLYATLTAWGLHRMGDAEKTKAKLTKWERFRDSLLSHADSFHHFRGLRLLETSEEEYSQTILGLRDCYESLELSASSSTLVVNSKALYHLFPDLIPPIDRQYTIRFFTKPPEVWRDKRGKFRQIQLPPGKETQFDEFCRICAKFKRLADKIDPDLFEEQYR